MTHCVLPAAARSFHQIPNQESFFHYFLSIEMYTLTNRGKKESSWVILIESPGMWDQYEINTLSRTQTQPKLKADDGQTWKDQPQNGQRDSQREASRYVHNDSTSLNSVKLVSNRAPHISRETHTTKKQQPKLLNHGHASP